MGKINFAIGLHNHQPVGNFDGVFEDAFQRAYSPFIELVKNFPEIKFAIHNSGSLHEWIEEHHPEYIDTLAEMSGSGQAEIVGGAFYEPILTILPESDRIGQLSLYSRHLEEKYGQEPRGAWLAERVWEQFLARSLAKSGVQYTMLDDTHFKNAGLTEEKLLGYYTTEHEGEVINVLPISERLRYLIPFRSIEDVMNYLRSLVEDGRERLVVYADDGEKFGVWPGTHKHVYEDGWLRDFFEALRENASWINVIHFKDAIDRLAPLGKIYLPDASYREMGEWVYGEKPRENYEKLVQLLKDRGVFDQVSFCIRGGTWRNFRTRYPEASRMYSKMFEVSRLVNGSGLKRKENALRELYRGQCNCAYWHGVFGGLYLPHLRTAVYEKLISAEKMVGDDKFPRVEHSDFDFDGKTEIKISTKNLNLYFKPDVGGQLYEMDLKPLNFNLSNTLSRKKEYYHREIGQNRDGSDQDAEVPSIHEISTSTSGLEKDLKYDRYSRVSLIDHILEPGVTPESLEKCEYAEFSGTACSRRKYEIDAQKNLLEMTSREIAFAGHNDTELELNKIISPGDDGDFSVSYRLQNKSNAEFAANFAVEFNFAMLSDRDPAKWYFNGDGNKIGSLADISDLGSHSVFGIRDERVGLQVRIKSKPKARIMVHPVYSVNHSESGFEKVFQCCAVFLVWKFDCKPAKNCDFSLDIHVGKI